MYESPVSLEETCLDVICHNILTYIEPQIQTEDGWTSAVEGSDCYDDERSDKRYKFRDSHIFLINKISEKLMAKMMEKRILCDATLNIFTEHNTILKVVKIRNCKVTKCGLQVLKQHKITDLEIVNVKNISIGDILDCLGEWSIQNIVNANFSKCTFINAFRYSFMVKITSLKHLRVLNLSQTELNQATFQLICEDLKHLENLDISCTQVTDLSPLALLGETLIALSICNLVNAIDTIIETLMQLANLKFFDMSIYNEKLDAHKLDTPIILQLLEIDGLIPNIVSLDISGWKKTLFDAITVEVHP